MAIQRKTEALLEMVDEVIAADPDPQTVRQIFYQLVSHYEYENSINSYKRLADALANARLSGRISWDDIEDRTRDVKQYDFYEYVPLSQFLEDQRTRLKELDGYFWAPKWHGQPQRVIIMLEKLSLIGRFENICKEWEVDLVVCKGYPSLSQQYELALRIGEKIDVDAELHIIYFGDFDPSGENIYDKLTERLSEDFNIAAQFRKECLTEQQTIDMQLPPAPAKKTDTRTQGMEEKYGYAVQIELDAVKNSVTKEIVESAIAKHFDFDIGARRDRIIRNGRQKIRQIVERMDIDSLMEMESEEDE